MAEKIKLYYSVDILLEKMELEDLLENNLKNSFSEHKTSVWLENDIYYGEIILILDIKNNNTIGTIKLNLINNIIEGFFIIEGPKINFFTNKLNIISDWNMNNEYFINNGNIYGIITLNKL